MYQIDSKAAFEHAITRNGPAGEQPEDYMYMYSTTVDAEHWDHFKHVDTRTYARVRRHDYIPHSADLQIA